MIGAGSGGAPTSGGIRFSSSCTGPTSIGGIGITISTGITNEAQNNPIVFTPLTHFCIIAISQLSYFHELNKPGYQSIIDLSNQSLDHPYKSDMLYYYICCFATVNAVFCDAVDGDHQNVGYDSDRLFTMGMTRLRGA